MPGSLCNRCGLSCGSPELQCFPITSDSDHIRTVYHNNYNFEDTAGAASTIYLLDSGARSNVSAACSTRCSSISPPRQCFCAQ